MIVEQWAPDSLIAGVDNLGPGIYIKNLQPPQSLNNHPGESNMRSVIFSIIIACCCAMPLLAQEQGAPDMAEMMKKWKEAGSPNDHHKPFASMVGKWTTESSMWMGGPGTPPSV